MEAYETADDIDRKISVDYSVFFTSSISPNPGPALSRISLSLWLVIQLQRSIHVSQKTRGIEPMLS